MISRGIDPDTMTIEDYVTVAWSVLYDEVPMMGDAHKYRRWLYEALWVGELSSEMQAELDKAHHENVKANIGKTPTPKSALDELARVREMREAARREREGATD